jgi:hypothetical protein
MTVYRDVPVYSVQDSPFIVDAYTGIVQHRRNVTRTAG